MLTLSLLLAAAHGFASTALLAAIAAASWGGLAVALLDDPSQDDADADEEEKDPGELERASSPAPRP
jgi:hypothetical protein